MAKSIIYRHIFLLKLRLLCLFRLLFYNGDKEIGGNFMKNRYAIVSAAGQGTRMKSKLYKVLHPVLGQPMIRYVMDGLKPSEVEELVTVVGHGAEAVMAEIGDYVSERENTNL